MRPLLFATITIPVESSKITQNPSFSLWVVTEGNVLNTSIGEQDDGKSAVLVYSYVPNIVLFVTLCAARRNIRK